MVQCKPSDELNGRNLEAMALVVLEPHRVRQPPRQLGPALLMMQGDDFIAFAELL